MFETSDEWVSGYVTHLCIVSLLFSSPLLQSSRRSCSCSCCCLFSPLFFSSYYLPSPCLLFLSEPDCLRVCLICSPYRIGETACIVHASNHNNIISTCNSTSIVIRNSTSTYYATYLPYSHRILLLLPHMNTPLHSHFFFAIHHMTKRNCNNGGDVFRFCNV